jgi:CheY-like chemotaxis protein
MLGKAKSRKKKILIVDDDPMITDLLAEFCGGELDYEVKCLNDSAQVAGTALSWQPDLITLDLEMPGKDGLEVLKELKADPATRGIPVFIISIIAHEAPVPAQAVNGVFDKPIRFQPLLKQIKTLLEPATA